MILIDGHLNALCDLFDLAREFETNLKTTFPVAIAPCFVTVGGALFLHFGLVVAFVLSEIGLLAGIANAVWPLIQHRGTPRKIGNHKPCRLEFRWTE